MDETSVKIVNENQDVTQRDIKLENQVYKSLGGGDLLKKYVELDKENKKLNSNIKQQTRHYELLLKEKENLQKELNKGILIRDKLEKVCREQQKLIKSVKNESLAKIREEEERRKENQVKFQNSIDEVSKVLNKNNEENQKLREDNIEMTKKLKILAERCQSREDQLEKISEDVKVECQLYEAKLTKVQMEAAIEKEIILREKQLALDELLKCKQSIQELQNREVLLREQLDLYTSKYDDFQNSLQKSSDIFSTYKKEMDKMQKNTRKLEKESLEWKEKWESSNAILIELSTEKQIRDEHIAKTTRQMQQLQKLLRALQVERATLHQILKDNNIERPSVPELPSEPEPVQSSETDKLDLMTKNCAELKKTLAKLQGQMNEMTGKYAEESRNTPAKDKKNKKKIKAQACPSKEPN